MSGPLYPPNMAAHGPTRSLEQYLDDLLDQLKRLPLSSKARGELVTRIRQVEAEIDARQPL